jgi:hypothetical protein
MRFTCVGSPAGMAWDLTIIPYRGREGRKAECREGVRREGERKGVRRERGRSRKGSELEMESEQW